MSSTINIAVSAPGKVLFAGGYLVLDQEYSGLVFALNSRIHVLSAPFSGAIASPGMISVVSPQFKNARWDYSVDIYDEYGVAGGGGGGRVTIKQLMLKGKTKNCFVETTIRYVLNFLYKTSGQNNRLFQSSTFTILADNDYYSQPQSATPIPRFNNLGVTLSEAHKTGLGSSAALVTALTACVYASYSTDSQIPLDSPETQTIIHNLAQAAHCAAQGKVGSGFDVATAVYGSCQYWRFSPSILDPIRADESPKFAINLAQVANSKWDFTINKRRIPPGLRIVMGDVDCGSSTPSMVKKVLSWRKEHSDESKELWDTLNCHNTDLTSLFTQLEKVSDEDSDEYTSALKLLSTQVGPFSLDLESSNRVVSLLGQIRTKIRSIRKVISTMGHAAGVPIEPTAQTRLLDHVTDYCVGVLGGVVPGAGGFDAVAFVVVDDIQVLDRLKETLEGWRFGADTPSGGKVKVLDAREEHEGLRWEGRQDYREWI